MEGALSFEAFQKLKSVTCPFIFKQAEFIFLLTGPQKCLANMELLL
jgi:hypothetical protein